jgi:hypothetical protein
MQEISFKMDKAFVTDKNRKLRGSKLLDIDKKINENKPQQ